ncbi:MAG: insulinase family protein [candidate division Zixibacteria bacterium]|nr:insulinase family protein [candidate division Zixibacteria bacterium]
MLNRKRTLVTVLTFICLGVICGSAFAFDFSSVEDKITEFTLDNGMKFIVMEDHSAPVISFVLQANVGGSDDPKDAMGLSHFWEHMAFKGTSEIGTKDIKKERKALKKLDAVYAELRLEQDKGIKADSVKLQTLEESFEAAKEEAESFVEIAEFSLIVEQEGGVGLNAGTGYDNTTYYYSFPSNRLELWFYLESSRFSDPVFRQFYKERDVIQEERRMGVESSPTGRMVDEFLHAAFRAHPYGLALIGEMSEIKKYTKEDMLAHYQKYYVASNLVAAIVGDVDPKEAEKFAKKYFGKLPKKDKPKNLIIVDPVQKATRRVVIPEKSQPMLLMGFQRPAGTHPDDVVYDAIADYLGQGRTSLLYKNLVNEQKIATNAMAFASFPGSKYACQFGIYVIPAKDITAAECETGVLAQIDQLLNEPIPAEELENIKARAKANLINSLASRNGMANNLVGYQTLYGDWRGLFKSLDEVNAVTAEDIQRVAKEMFVNTRMTVASIETIEE